MRKLIFLSFTLLRSSNASESTHSLTEIDVTPSLSSFELEVEDIVEFFFLRGNPDKNELRAAISSLDTLQRKYLDNFILQKKKNPSKIIEFDTKIFKSLPVLIQTCLLYRKV